jgi:hypothetical protein
LLKYTQQDAELQNKNICRNFAYFTGLHIYIYIKKKKLHGLSPRANYTDRATAACWLLWIEGPRVVSVTDPYGHILGF